MHVAVQLPDPSLLRGQQNLMVRVRAGVQTLAFSRRPAWRLCADGLAANSPTRLIGCALPGRERAPSGPPHAPLAIGAPAARV
jgi:hypothetical protein